MEVSRDPNLNLFCTQLLDVVIPGVRLDCSISNDGLSDQSDSAEKKFFSRRNRMLMSPSNKRDAEKNFEMPAAAAGPRARLSSSDRLQRLRQSFAHRRSNSATIVDHTRQFDELFIVLAYESQDVKKVLKSVTHGTRLTEQHVKTIMYNSLLGVNFLHKLGIVHRDIKPANLLMHNECQIKICDFGMSRALPRDCLTARIRDNFFSALDVAAADK